MINAKDVKTKSEEEFLQEMIIKAANLGHKYVEVRSSGLIYGAIKDGSLMKTLIENGYKVTFIPGYSSGEKCGGTAKCFIISWE